MAGLCRSSFFIARKGLIAKGLIRQLKGLRHELTGVDNDWEIDRKAWDSPGNRDANKDAIIPETRTESVPETGMSNPVLNRVRNHPTLVGWFLTLRINQPTAHPLKAGADWLVRLGVWGAS